MRLDLVENGPACEVPLDHATGAALALSKVVTAIPTTTAGWWEVGPSNRVGVATVAGVEIRVTPKIQIARLFFLLGYARSGPAWRDEDVTMSDAPDLVTALAEAFTRQADRALSRGLIQGYRVTEEALPVVRGRIREADQMRRRFGLAVPVEIRYDDYSVDIPENQILRAAAARLLRLPGVAKPVRQRLMRLTRLFVDVHTPVHGRLLPAWRPSRLNARYHVALRLAEMVLGGTSLEQADGTVRVSGFMINMSKLFEDFVTVALHTDLAEYGGSVRAQDRWHLDVLQQVAMKPDIVWRNDDGSARAVIDAKYKAEKPQGFPDADLYQILAYCTALGLRRGHLIYAKGNETAQSHTVRNAGIEIVQHALDLDQPPQQLLESLGAMARTIAEGANGRV